MVGMWFGEFCSWCCLLLLPQLACSILPTTYQPLFSPLYRAVSRSIALESKEEGRTAEVRECHFPFLFRPPSPAAQKQTVDGVFQVTAL